MVNIRNVLVFEIFAIMFTFNILNLLTYSMPLATQNILIIFVSSTHSIVLGKQAVSTPPPPDPAACEKETKD